MATQYPVLMYHGIHDSDEEPGRFDSVYSVSRKQYIEQLDWLQDNGFRACTLTQADEAGDDEKLVIITFDDGDITNFTEGLKPLQERGMLAEFYITTDWIDNDFSMSAEQLRKLDQVGMAIDSHGKTHSYLSDLDDVEMRLELEESKRKLEDILGHEIITIALPGGRGDQRTTAIAKDLGYKKLCTSVLGYNNKKSDPFKLNRLAVTRQLSLEDFASLVSADGRVMRKMKLRQFILTSMKTVLGNKLYEVVRSKFLPA